MRAKDLSSLLAEARACTICADALPHGVRPVFRVAPTARILIAGQAPGRRVHESGVPFDDPSGERLRDWMGVDRDEFYDESKVAILPMGFCYPGTGNGGDLPPRSECAPAWRERLLAALPVVETTLVIGQYALDYHIPDHPKTVTASVQGWRDSWPRLLPMPHPSPRNLRWLKRNPWFEGEVVPQLRQRVRELLTS